MQFPTSLRRLLNEISCGPTHVNDSIRHFLRVDVQNDLSELLDFSSSNKNLWQQEIGLIAIWRAFLSLLPSDVLEYPEQPCRNTVRDRLIHLLGEEPSSRDLEVVMQVVKRIQRYCKGGRRTIARGSFDLDLVSHVRILRRQSYRCANCGYRFKDMDLDSDLFDESSEGSVSSPVNPSDRSPRRLRRKAVLDHIIPIYLGGDREENWQVLCACCNLGKSDLFFGFEGKAWFGSVRIMDFIEVKPQLFYMVLNRDNVCSNCGRGARQTELRIVRRELSGGDIYSNLNAKCVDCIKCSS